MSTPPPNALARMSGRCAGPMTMRIEVRHDEPDERDDAAERDAPTPTSSATSTIEPMRSARR